MNCSEIQDLLSAYHDKELAAELNRRVATHLSQCSGCATELARFERLGRLARELERPQPSGLSWEAIENRLREPPELSGPESVSQAFPARSWTRPVVVRALAALAAGILIVVVGYRVFSGGDHDHQEMVQAIDYLAAHADAPDATRYLANRYNGRQITAADAMTLVGYRPIATNGLPGGYAVENIQVLEMPCCKCTQTACQRPDHSRFFVFEHENEEPGWFEHRKRHSADCCGKRCRFVELDDRIALTWKEGSRHITLLGIRDEQEAKLILEQLGKKS